MKVNVICIKINAPSYSRCFHNHIADSYSNQRETLHSLNFFHNPINLTMYYNL